jgi:hypothetical protein
LRITSAIVLLALLTASPALAYTWEPVGMAGVATTCIEADTDHDRVLVGTYEGFWIYDQATEIWSEFDEEGWIGRQVHAIQSDHLDPLRIVTGRENAFFKGYLELSLDGGATGGVVHMSQGGSFVDIEPHEGFFFACGISDITPGELLRSPDGGETWTTSTGYGHTAMTAVASGKWGEVAVAGDDQFWYSEDLGATWQDGGAGLGAGLVHCLVSYWPGSDVITSPYLAGNDLGLWQGDFADGLQWQQILTGEAVREIAVMWSAAPWPISIINRFVVVTADGRVLVSDHAWPANWVDETGNLPSAAVDAAYSAFDRHLYVCTANDGVHRFGPVTSATEDVPTIATTTLEAWPNPFNPQVSIGWFLPRDGAGRLAIYDLAGRLVATLQEGTFTAGDHTLTWNAAGEASGVYVARLETDQGLASARLVLVR